MNSPRPRPQLMFSERAHDGIERSAEQWFKRHNPKSPEQGGAKKSRAAVPQSVDTLKLG